MIGQIVEDRYKVIDKLGEGGLSLVYRAEDIQTGQVVALKFLKEGITSRRVEDVLRFQREAGAVAKLEHPGIVKVYATGEYKQTPYIVMEFVEGKSLADFFREQRRFSVEEAVEMVLQISEVLNYVHGKGIVHRDLKPGNIMLMLPPATQQPFSTKFQIKVLDFGLALILELKEIKSEEEIVGTFGYMSPEQTGIVHKPVDERSDLYSLGIIFYQLVIGQLPFKGKDISTLLHQQVAKSPIAISQLNPDIPRVIDEIVMKLLNKDMEKRYQTGAGLIFDLKRFQQGETIFAIATKDKKRRLTYRTRLIGREEELLHLKELFNQAQAGQGKLCLIAGEAGRGKSRLVTELRSYAYEQGGIFIEGKCFRQANKLPYQPFTEALNEYIKKVEYSSPQQKDKAIMRMKDILGELGGVIEKINPLIKGLIGESPFLIELEPERENRRFLTVSSNFFLHISTEEEPLVLYIDDLQWSDEASLTLLEEIASEIRDSHLLILGTYRDNEVDPQHKLIKLIQEASKRGYALEEIKLSFFDQARTNRMVSELLGEKEEVTQEISTYIQDKSQGNPFFILEIIRQLVEEGVLYCKEELWEIDQERLQAITIPTNIVDVVLHRIDALSEDKIEIFSHAAVIGREFTIELLFSIIDKPKEAVINVVDQAILLQLLEWKMEERGRLLFVHERIRGAFYKKMGKEKLRGIHLKIAQVLEEINRENIEPVIFDLAHHYSEAGQKDKILKYAPIAAKKSKESYANQDAERYFNISIALLEERQQKGGPLWISYQEGLGEVYLTIGKYEQAVVLLKALIPFKKKTVERALLQRQISTAYFKMGDYAHCEKEGLKGLELLGEGMPKGKIGLYVSLFQLLLIHIIYSLFPGLFTHKEGKPVEPKYPALIWIYLTLGWLYILTKVENILICSWKILNISERRIGKSKELGLSLACCAQCLAAIPFFKIAIKYHLKGLMLRKELGDLWGEAQSHQLTGYCYLWKGEYQKSIQYFQEGLDKFHNIGDMWEQGMVLNGMVVDYIFLGNSERALECGQKYLQVSNKIKDISGICSAQGFLGWAYLRRGELEEARRILNASAQVSEEKHLWLANCVTTMRIGEIYLEKGEYEKAIEYLLRAKKLNEENIFLKDYIVPIYSLLAESYMGKHLQDKAQEAVGVRQKKANLKNIKRLCWRVLWETRPWKNHWGSTWRVNAQYQALIGNKARAEKYFLQSIAHTEKLGQKYKLGKSHYEYGRWLGQINRQEEARRILKKAFDIFKQINSRLYLKRTIDLLGYKEEEAKETAQEPETVQRRLRTEQRLMSLIKVSQYLSSILDLDKLLERIMDSAVEVVGAERGFLMLYHGIVEDKKIDEETKGNLEVMVARNADKESLGSEAFQASRTVMARVEKTHQPSVITDAITDEELRTQVSVVKYNLRSILCVPLITKKNELLGIIYLDNRLISGLFTQNDLDLLEALAVQAGISIENAVLIENEKKIARYEQELQIARQIQLALLPEEYPQIEKAQIRVFYQAAKEVGGDYYDFIQVDKEKLGIVVGDVSGKGVPAAILMAMIRSVLRSQAVGNPSVIEVLSRVNDLLVKDMKKGTFVSMFYGILDIKNRKFFYGRAGHPPTILFRSKNGSCDLLMPKGMALGVMGGDMFNKSTQQEEVQLDKGDLLVFYTDGVTEAKNREDELFGKDRLLKTVMESGAEDAQTFINRLKERIKDFTKGYTQSDDITVIGVKFL